MIYTVGHGPSYREGLKEGPLWKQGPGEKSTEWPDGYPGGIAFRMAEDARAAILASGWKTYAVFKIAGDFDSDTWMLPSGAYSIRRHLLILGEAS